MYRFQTIPLSQCNEHPLQMSALPQKGCSQTNIKNFCQAKYPLLLQTKMSHSHQINMFN